MTAFHPARAGAAGHGFTLFEMVIALTILAFLGIAGLESMRTILGGYLQARTADAVAQKAQIALQRMTVEFTYIDTTSASNSGSGTSLTYAATSSSNVGTHTISQSGSNLMYTQGGQSYILSDCLAANGLSFQYYSAYDGTAGTTFSNASTTLIQVTLIMHDDTWGSGVNKTFSTRIALNKIASSS